ncbi:hypothetical protein N9891_01690 [bacterium]|nr:hypothetical protein [bacterium]
MHGILTIIKIFAAILVLAILGALVFFLQEFREKFADPETTTSKPLERIIEDHELVDFEPGQHEFNRGLEFIALQRLDEAREKLLFIQNLYPNSANAPEARRILGEINLDEILSIENMDNKEIHTVTPGEGYLRIANNHQTTLDCIMFLNGLTEMGSLHTGDELIVMPLDFKLVVDLAKMRVDLYHRDREKMEHVFAKAYPIQSFDFAGLRKGTYQSKISRKLGEIDGRTYQPTHSKYRHALKVLGFKVGGGYYQFRPVPAADAEDPGQGVFLNPADMEELSMLIRVGNEVEVKIAG